MGDENWRDIVRDISLFQAFFLFLCELANYSKQFPRDENDDESHDIPIVTAGDTPLKWRHWNTSDSKVCKNSIAESSRKKK